jgi:hypothetical protein
MSELSSNEKEDISRDAGRYSLESGKEIRSQGEEAAETAKALDQANLRKSKAREKSLRLSKHAGNAQERAAEGVHGWTIDQASDVGEGMNRIAKERSFTMGDATADTVQSAAMTVRETATGIKEKVSDVTHKLSDTQQTMMETLRNTGSSIKYAATGDWERLGSEGSGGNEQS